MASLKNTTINDTGFLKVATGTQAQRPGSPTQGMTRFNTNTSVVEFWNGTTWVGIGLRDGSSIGSAADSAAAIKTLTGTTTDTFYWIIIDGVATNVWCDMNNNGGGWMMAMRCHNNNNRWTYNDGSWTNTTLFNEGQAFTFGDHIKTRVYTNRAFTQVRLVGGALSNGLVENWSYSSMISLMGTGQGSGNSRASWISWMTTAGGQDPLLQANCNQIGVNRAFNYMYVKIGITANNEGDCSTNDSALGFGVQGISPYGNQNSFGAFSSSGRNSIYTGAIFVK
jgi:hypothetical protein